MAESIVTETNDEFVVKSTWKVFGGTLTRFSHRSLETQTTMNCSVFIPPISEDTAAVGGMFPCLLYLSGLTCTDENVCQKAGGFKYLAGHQVRVR